MSNNNDDFPLSWSTPAFHPSTQKYKMAKVCPSNDGGEPKMNLVCPVQVADQPESTLPDIQSAEHAIHFLETYNLTQPFFLAVGFHKPHIPLKFPWEYLDLYRLDSMGLAPNRKLPRKLPPVAWNPWTDLRDRDDVKDLNISFPFGPMPDYFQKLVRQGYYAATSYMDDLIGKVLHALHETRAADNTIVLFTGDHGWSLGEHQEWSKYSNFEVALKVPLVIRPVGNFYRKFTYVSPLDYLENHILLRGNRDIASVRENPDFHFAPVKKYRDEFVELVDIFPTLVEMAGFDSLIQCPSTLPSPNLCTEGVSVAGFASDVPVEFSRWKTAVFSQYPRPSLFPQENSDQPKVKDVKVMGYTMRTEKYRYTEWVDFDAKHLVANFSKVFSRELYLKSKDMDEDNNVVGRYKYRKVVRKLAKMLRAGWRNCVPQMHGH